MALEVKALDVEFGYRHCSLLSAKDARAEVDTVYCGGLFDNLGGHLHPFELHFGSVDSSESRRSDDL